YPVVTYFHAAQAKSSFPLAYLKAADILFYIANHPNIDLRPPLTAIETLKNIITSHTKNMQPIVNNQHYDKQKGEEIYEILPQIRYAESQLFPWREFHSMRTFLVSACRYDGW
ncbi:MAG TPA: hypothetical protein VIC08_04625, partial [Cellvibrionaceae bacterium]